MSKEVNLMQMPSLNNQSGYRLHDLSHYFGFKCSTGHIVDLVHDVLNPGERVSLHPQVVVRMNPLVSPAMVDIDCDIHYFFVPFDMLDMGWSRKWSQTVEHFSSVMYHQTGSNTSDLACFKVNSDFLDRRKWLNQDLDSEFTSNEQECLGSRIFRNMDYMGLNPFLALQGTMNLSNAVDDNGDPIASVSEYVNAFDPYNFYYSILAYNAIWEYWYRLEDRDKFANWLFNVDQLYKTGSFGNMTARDLFDLHHCGEAFAIKYAPRKKDYFTSTFKAPVINGLNFLGFALSRNNEQFLDGGFGQEDLSFDPSAGTVVFPGHVVTQTGVNVDDQGLRISTQELRIMQAKEKYLNILGRLPRKNYDNLAYALFGDKIPHDVKHELSHLGHDHFTIRIDGVMSLADTGEQGGAPLGELAGSGFGSTNQRGASSRGVKFKAPCHGVVMALMSIVPNYMYYGVMQRHNFIGSMNDFYNPVYDNLGMQPMYAYELGCGGIFQETYDGDHSIPPTSLIGWQFMYTQWKQRANRLGMAFSEGNEKAWFNAKSPLGLNGVGTDIDVLSGSLPSDAETIYNSLSNQFFYCSPNSLNEIMGFQYTIEWQESWLTSEQQAAGVKQADLENWYLHPWQIYARDPFICLAHVNYKKFSKMSAYSLVQFD